MKTDYLRIVKYHQDNNTESTNTGIFHKWISKDEGIIALIEDFNTGEVIFVKTKQMRFLNFFETKDFWNNIENAQSI